MTELMTIEQEIVQLQRQLEAKKAELGGTQESIPHEKEILHEVVGEKIQQHAVQQQTVSDDTTTAPVPTPPPTASSPAQLTPELHAKVQELVNIAFTTNIADAIKEAVKTNNAAVIDAFHDVLVDELYGQLVERKKVEPL